MRASPLWPALLFLLAAAGRLQGAGAEQAPLNVHIVCHSHDDAGWLKTVDQYYYGANNTIQVAGVQYILDTVVQALAAHPARKFVYSEMSFFMRWWAQQDEHTRALVTQLVQNGQLDFVNGGYVQHDEATAHYVAMIDQTTHGHMFLLKTFGFVPRVGWQIDPFGHSSTQAALLSAHVGFDALFFGRADYQDMEHRKNLTAMEVVWEGSRTLGDASIFAGNFISGNYGPPEGFAFEWACPPIMDDPHLDEYNVQDRVDAFVAACRDIAATTRGNDIMLTIGSDFQFANAHLQYKNLDKLIKHANADGRLKVFYSTPAEYVRAKHAYKGERWPLKQDDFFPYADFPHAFWTGYFTSRPASKGFIRAATSYLQAARQLEAFVGVKQGGPTTESLEEAVSLLQHHDAITGTEKQHVTCDYHRRLARGLKVAQAVVTSALEAIIRGQYRPGQGPSPSSNAARGGLFPSADDDAVSGVSSQLRRRLQVQEQSTVGALSSSAGSGPSNPVDTAINLEVCDWLNVTACNATVRLSGAGKGFMVAAYNSLGWSREVPLRVPVNTTVTCGWGVTGPEGEHVASQLVPVHDATRSLQHMLANINATCPSTFGDAEVVFIARLPPLGYSTFFVEPDGRTRSSGDSRSSTSAETRAVGTQPARQAAANGWMTNGEDTAKSSAGESERYATLGNGIVSLEFDTHTGLLHSMSVQGAAVKLETNFGWYNSSDGLETEENRGQASGAYIFRPNGFYSVAGEEHTPGKHSSTAPIQLEFVRGETVMEARQVFADWATLVTRLYAGQAHVELEWTVGPIPFEDGLGREVVLTYSSDVDSGDEFWTDANGREMIKRIRDYRPSWELNQTEAVAGNYYPLTAAIYIQDADRQLVLLTDRAQGGASLKSGQMEVMLHRRTLADDARGVGEPLNETACGCIQCDCPGLVVRGKHWLALAPRSESARQRRTLQQELNDPPVLAFSAIPREVGGQNGGGRVGLRRTFSLSEGHILHSNVHLLTLKDTGSSYLVRLAHLYQEGEDAILSNPVTENLNAVLQLLHYNEVRELSLSGNQLRSDMQHKRLRFEAGDSLTNSSWLDGSASDSQKLQGSQIISCSGDCRNGELLVVLKPMEIRTLELIYSPMASTSVTTVDLKA